MKSIIEKLNLEPLNILDNSKLIYGKFDDGEKWTCETKIEGVECSMCIYHCKNFTQMYISTDIESEDTDHLLRKANAANLDNLGCGMCCYVDISDTADIELKSNIALKTEMFDFELYTKEMVADLINESIIFVPRMIKLLRSKYENN